MKTWTIYRYQAGDPRERWLRVGQLGTETEQNAIVAARAIWGDGSENHWHYAAEPFPPKVEMDSYPIDRPMAVEMPIFMATKSATRTGPEIDCSPLAGASDADPLEDHGEAIRELYERMNDKVSEGRFQSVERQLEDIERRLQGLNNRDAAIEGIREQLEKIEDSRAESAKEWHAWRAEAERKMTGADAGIASLEHRDETRERDAKGLAESVNELRGRVIEAEETDAQAVRLLGSVRREVAELRGNCKADSNRIWAAVASLERNTREPAPAYDPSRSPTRSVSPPESTLSDPEQRAHSDQIMAGIKGTRSAQATGGASAAFSPKVQTIDARPKSWNVFGHLRHPEATTLIGTVTARSKKSANAEAERTFKAELRKFYGWSVEPVEILLPEGELKDKAERIVEATNREQMGDGLYIDGKWICGPGAVTITATGTSGWEAKAEATTDEPEKPRRKTPAERVAEMKAAMRPPKPDKPTTVLQAESDPTIGGPLTGFDSQGHG